MPFGIGSIVMALSPMRWAYGCSVAEMEIAGNCSLLNHHPKSPELKPRSFYAFQQLEPQAAQVPEPRLLDA